MFINKLYIYTIIIVAICVLFCYFFFNGFKKAYVMPIFNTREELNNNASWKSYFEDIYYDIPAVTGISDGLSNYPLDTSDFFLLYKEPLDDAGIYIGSEFISNSCKEIEVKNNIVSTIMNNWSTRDKEEYWLNKLRPFNCLPDNTFTEIVHTQGDPMGGGTWMYNVKGSGIWFDVGKSICYRDHQDAVTEQLGKKCDDGGCDKHLVELMSTLAGKGYKSVQFTEHGDQHCGLRAMEIVHTTGRGFYACGFNPDDSDFGTCVAATFKAGWEHNYGCSCDSSRTVLNCDFTVT